MTVSSSSPKTAPPPPLPAPPDLKTAGRISLFLDFDGTLVDIAPHPDAIAVAADLASTLTVLCARLDGRLALVSGRQLAELEKHLGPLDIAMAGSHGGEFRAAGSRETVALAEPLPSQIVDKLRALSDAHGGLLMETKPFSAALHYRDRPQAGEALIASARAICEDHGLHLKAGKMVVEVVMPGSDKGTAVATFMKMPGFTGTRPLFVGDDVTDEDAFRQVLKHEGGGVLVGPDRDTSALWRLSAVEDVHAWLKAALA